MKRLNYLIHGFAALVIVVLFSQCSGNAGNNTTGVAETTGSISTSNMKIAFVEIDSLLTSYDFWNDLNEAMLKKEENIRVTLTQRGRELENEINEFQRKIENNGFATRERAEQEQNRLMKRQQELQELQNKLTSELAAENQANSFIFRDSINSFLREYNKIHNYSMIFSKTGFDNLLYADSVYDITKEIADGLNARYSKK
ncbi:MAG: OmpH family outer membrane protein [Bacteroides sp.]|nr:OmpH family outer membrane protein [Bacteroides sp.]